MLQRQGGDQRVCRCDEWYPHIEIGRVALIFLDIDRPRVEHTSHNLRVANDPQISGVSSLHCKSLLAPRVPVPPTVAVRFC